MAKILNMQGKNFKTEIFMSEITVTSGQNGWYTHLKIKFKSPTYQQLNEVQ